MKIIFLVLFTLLSGMVWAEELQFNLSGDVPGSIVYPSVLHSRWIP